MISGRIFFDTFEKSTRRFFFSPWRVWVRILCITIFQGMSLPFTVNSRFNLFIVSVFWSFMADIFSNAQAKRLFGMIAAGGTIGALVEPALSAGRFVSQGQRHSTSGLERRNGLPMLGPVFPEIHLRPTGCDLRDSGHIQGSPHGG